MVKSSFKSKYSNTVIYAQYNQQTVKFIIAESTYNVHTGDPLLRNESCSKIGQLEGRNHGAKVSAGDRYDKIRDTIGIRPMEMILN